MLDYKLVEAMAAVIQEGGFDRAAKKLYLTQSAVSQRVRQLEEQLGRILLVRSSPPSPTEEGRRLLKHYLQVKRLEDDVLGEVGKESGMVSVAVGINADSLATWFTGAVRTFLLQHKVVLDVRVDDQEQTHRLLKGGEVVGCISTRGKPMQGCRNEYLGSMVYRMLAAPDFIDKWFADGLSLKSFGCAPALIYNRKDELHFRLLEQAKGEVPAGMPVNYIPSSEQFVEIIRRGIAYGMVPDLQSSRFQARGELVDLFPEHCIEVDLYWHCWNLNSPVLAELTAHLLNGARESLGG